MLFLNAAYATRTKCLLRKTVQIHIPTNSVLCSVTLNKSVFTTWIGRCDRHVFEITVKTSTFMKNFITKSLFSYKDTVFQKKVHPYYFHDDNVK